MNGDRRRFSPQDYRRLLTVGVPSTYVTIATTAPTITNGTASKRIPIAAATGAFCVHSIVDAFPDSVAGGDTLGTDSLNEGFVLDSTADPPLFTSTSPSTVVGALVVAVLKTVTTIRFHGDLS